MQTTLRFLIDVGIATRVAVSLRDSGYDCIHLREENLQQLPDDEIIRKAQQERRIIITHDLDFGRLIATSGMSLPSIITFRLSNMRSSAVIAELGPLLKETTAALENGAVVVISDSGFRVRKLPVR